MIDKYHTAVGVFPHNVSEFNEKFEKNGIIIIKHDITKPAPDEFSLADCIIVEPAWKDGYNKFKCGTIAENTEYEDYMRSIEYLCKTLCIPTFIVIGKSSKKYFSGFKFYDIKFKQHGGYPCVLAVLNCDKDLSFIKNEHDARKFVASEYLCILDPCCGYGNILNHVLPKGKNAILADINDECLNYIKGELQNERI